MDADQFVSLVFRLAPLAPVPLCPELTAHQARDIYELWGAWEELVGAPTEAPFWGTVWPAASFLARYLLDNQGLVAGRSVLDVGCGGGIVAIAAARAGARRCEANDIDRTALMVAVLNAKSNSVGMLTRCGDLTRGGAPAGVETVLVADMFYEKGPSDRLLSWLGVCGRSGARVIVADGGRTFAPVNGMRELASGLVEVDRGLEGVHCRTVRVLELEA